MQITEALARRPGGDFSIEAVELDEPRADEIRVRIAAVGVCHTDLVARDGAMPFTLPAVFGHEGAGGRNDVTGQPLLGWALEAGVLER